MNGAQSLVTTLINCGLDTCFTNPGTSEMHFVAALDKIPGLTCVLGLQENVVTGMADGYYRIKRRPAATLLHCGPGLANGLANLHNARRAKSGIVNIVGDQATYHRPHDAPLTADTSSFAKAVSGWMRAATCSAEVGQAGAEAVRAASGTPGQVATLILPSDTSWNEGGVACEMLAPLAPQPLDPHQVREAAIALRSGKETLILLGGEALQAPTQELAWQIAQATGATVMVDYVTGYVARGAGRPPLMRVPYLVPDAIKALEKYENLILVNAKAPVGFFGYPNMPSIEYPANAQVLELARDEQDPLAALKALADDLRVCKRPLPDIGPRPEAPTGKPTPTGLFQLVAALMPEDSIIMEESVSYSVGLYEATFAAPAHDMMHLPGGAIGDGLPVATGAALAAERQRRVIDLQADGSAMYTIQALWTQAREKLPITTIILSNRKYNILQAEYVNVGATPGQTAMDMLSLDRPDLDFVKIANGMGVEAARTDTLDGLADLMLQSFASEAPFLIELAV